METKVEQTPATNSNPVLSVDKTGYVLYSNDAGNLLLNEWGIGVREKLPSSIGEIVQRVISRNAPEKIEIKVGNEEYLVVFSPLPEQECVNISGFDISDHRELEEKPRENDAQEITDLELADIIDAQEIQFLMEDFYKFAHITIALVDLKGNILVKVGWQDICTKFHRVHPETCKHCVESDTKLSAGVSPGEFKLYKCKNNMWDIATPIITGGQHIGNIFSGQFFFEDELPDYELFRAQARKYGFNENEYIEALEKVPRFSRKDVDTIMAFFMKFANMISQLSYSNIKLSQSLAERDALMEALQDSEKRERDRSNELAAVLDAVPVAVYISHDSQALQITGNRFSYEWLRIPVGTNFSKSVPEGERTEMFKLFKDGVEIPPENMPSQMAAQGKVIDDCELDIVSVDGEIRHVLGNARPLLDEKGKIRGSVSAFIDITKRKKAEEALKQTNDHLDKLVKKRTAELEEAFDSLKEVEEGLADAQRMAHIGNWKWNPVIDRKYWSDEVYRIFGLKPQEPEIAYNTFLSYVHPDDRVCVENATKEALKGKPYSINFRIILADGEERLVHEEGEGVFDEKSIPIRIKGTIQDITEFKKAEEKIQILANAVESSSDAIGTLSLDGIFTSWNKGAEQVYGYSAKEILGKPTCVVAPLHLSEETKKLSQLVKQGEMIHQYETLRLRKDGKIISVSITLSPVYDIHGKLIAISFISRDITKRKEAEEVLAKIEIARKQEIHHRIKNNLQVISSLLDLQTEKFKGRKDIKDTEVLETFRESQDRIISMALIHEELHKGSELDTLNFSHYIEELVDNLFLTYRIGIYGISLDMDVEEDIYFDMDTSVPLGIIINELISNSLKHAFIGRDEGEIQIKLHREKNGEAKIDADKSTTFILSVSDNGIGIPEDLEIEELDSLGLQLVTTLADQLEGKLELKRNNGTEFTIRFTVTEKNDKTSLPTPQLVDND